MKFLDLIAHQSTQKIANEQENLEKFTKGTIALKYSEKIYDLRDKIDDLEHCEAVTYQDEYGLEILRHDLAHIMAQAIHEIYPNEKPLFAIGPVIENGFFYDFDMDHKISEEELEKIEGKMQDIIKRNLPILKYEVPRDLALEFFEKKGEKYKVEIINYIPGNENITIYAAGEDGKEPEFIDLCRGPHALTTRFQAAFKLTKIAGAYWRGDSKNKMLQRIYGVAFASKEELKTYLTRMKEAELRDHRKLGRELGLFHLQEEAQGQVFWHPRGYTIYKIIEQYIRNKLDKNGYVEVKTPLLADRVLWEKSGHWEKFKENMFVVEQKEDEQKQFAIKPMNCPLHVQIFKQNTYSYRDLPLRMAEFGCCHRHESSGALHGIMRVLSFTQDDAHIFCTNKQITEEIVAFCKLLKEVYADFGFKDVKVKLSDRPPVRAGEDETWDEAELALETAVKTAGLPYTINKGEGAFYGPKLEFVLLDAIGRDWQCGTMQVDFVLPERLDAHYVDNDGSQKRPVMLHRAIIGTFERFIGILIENYTGNFPFWLAPVQIVIINVTNAVDDYALEVFNQLKDKFRVEIDLDNEQLNYKLRKYSKLKTPVICIIGNEEKDQNIVSMRYFGGKDTVKFKLNEVVEELKKKFV